MLCILMVVAESVARTLCHKKWRILLYEASAILSLLPTFWLEVIHSRSGNKLETDSGPYAFFSGADPCFLKPKLHHGDRPIDFEHVANPIQQSIGCERFLHEIVCTGGTEFGDAIVLDHPRDA